MGAGASAAPQPKPPAQLRRKPKVEEIDHGYLSVPSASSALKLFEPDQHKPASAIDVKSIPVAHAELKRYVELIPSFKDGLLHAAQQQIARARTILAESSVPSFTLNEIDELLLAADELVAEVQPLLDADPITGVVKDPETGEEVDKKPEEEKYQLQRLLDKQDEVLRSKDYKKAGELQRQIFEMSTRKGGDEEHIRLNRCVGMLRQLAKVQKRADRLLATLMHSQLESEVEEVAFGRVVRSHVVNEQLDASAFRKAEELSAQVRALATRRRPLINYVTRFRENKVKNDAGAPGLYHSKRGRFRTMPLCIDKRAAESS